MSTTTPTRNVKVEMVLTSDYRFALRTYRNDGSKAKFVTTTNGTRRTWGTRDRAEAALARITFTDAEWHALTVDDRPPESKRKFAEAQAAKTTIKRVRVTDLEIGDEARPAGSTYFGIVYEVKRPIKRNRYNMWRSEPHRGGSAPRGAFWTVVLDYNSGERMAKRLHVNRSWEVRRPVESGFDCPECGKQIVTVDDHHVDCWYGIAQREAEHEMDNDSLANAADRINARS